MSFRQTGIKITEKKGKFVNEKKTKNFIQDTHKKKRDRQTKKKRKQNVQSFRECSPLFNFYVYMCVCVC